MKIATKLRATLAFVLLFFAAGVAHTYEVSPMRIFLVPSAGQTQGTISINNNRAVPLPVEMKILRRHVAEDGTQSFTPADDDFIVFPPQFQVPAGTSQGVRFQYIGPADVAESQAYVVQVSEVPVQEPGATGFNVVYNFGVAVYIEPRNATDRLSVESAEVVDGTLRLRVRNAGVRYGYVNDNGMNLSAGAATLQLTRDEAAARIENPLIPPNSVRSFTIPVPELPTGPVNVRLRRG